MVSCKQQSHYQLTTFAASSVSFALFWVAFGWEYYNLETAMHVCVCGFDPCTLKWFQGFQNTVFGRNPLPKSLLMYWNWFRCNASTMRSWTEKTYQIHHNGWNHLFSIYLKWFWRFSPSVAPDRFGSWTRASPGASVQTCWTTWHVRISCILSIIEWGKNYAFVSTFRFWYF